MADKVALELLIEASESAKTVGELRKSIKDLKNEALAVGHESPEAFNALTKAASEAGERLKEVNENIAASNPENLGKSFAKLGASIGGAFEVGMGASALFGAESANLEKQLVKIQAVMALTQGISEVGELGKNFGIAMTSAKAFYAQLASGEIKTKAIAVATRVWNAVLAANPIFILVAVITAVVGAMALLAAKESEETELLKANIAEREKSIKAMDESIAKMKEDSEFRLAMMKAEGKSEEEITLQKKRETDARVKELERQNEALVETIHEKERVLRNADEEEKKELEEQIKELNEKRKENYATIQKDYRDLQLELKTERTKALEEEKKAEDEKRKKAAEAAKKRAEELLAAEKELQQKLKSLRFENITDEREKIKKQYEQELEEVKNNISKNEKLKGELRAELKIKYDKILEDYDKEQRDKKAAEDLASLEKNRQEELLTLENRKNDLLNQDRLTFDAQRQLENEQFELKKQQANLNAEQLEQLRVEHNASLKAIDDAENAEKLKTEQQIADAKLSIQQSSFSSLQSLGELFIKDSKKLEKFKKAMALVEIGIDTARAISGLNAEAAQASAKMAGILGPATPIFTAAYYASGVARILGNVAKAKALLGASGGGGDIGGGGGTGARGGNAPQRNDDVARIAEANTGRTKLDTPTVKAVVVETDITSTQKRVNSIEEKASI